MSDTHESSENYLEAILILSMERPVVRSIDIADFLDFKKSSVSVAMKKLRESGDIEVTKEGFIYLTESGEKTANMIYERHVLISNWLISLGVDSKTAHYDACRMEHVMSSKSFRAVKAHLKEKHHEVYEESHREFNRIK